MTPEADLATLRAILQRWDVEYQWTGPKSKVEEPWRPTCGFMFHDLLQYRLVSKQSEPPHPGPSRAVASEQAPLK